MRKTRSVLLLLPEAQQAKLAEWLLSGMTYHAAQEIIAKPEPEGFGVVVRSLSAFAPFWQEVCVPHLARRRALAVSTAESVAEEASRTPGRFDSATIDQLKQKVFELSISPHADPKDVKALFMLVLKAKDQELEAQALHLDREKFEFLKKKAEQAEQAEKVIGSNEGSAEEKQQKLRAIFGMS